MCKTHWPVKETLMGTAFVLPAIASQAPNSVFPSDENKSAYQATQEQIATWVLEHSQDYNKRTAQKVYHRFEDIPEISDKEAAFYSPGEYTYIVNAKKYQKTGELELKRVLKKEVTDVNIVSVSYRNEGGDYTPKANEDQIKKYAIDLKLRSKSGTYLGPTQMNEDAMRDFIKYLAINPSTEKYMTSYLTTTGKTSATKIRENMFDNDGNIQQTFEQREKEINTSKTYSQITFKLGSAHQVYLNLVNKLPKNLLIKEIQNFYLSFYPINRKGKPKDVANIIAKKMGFYDKKGNIDATRIPPYVLGTICHKINSIGNGLGIKSYIEKQLKIDEKSLKNIIKDWTTNKKGKAASKAYYAVQPEELPSLTILTEEIINQFERMEIAGSKELNERYYKLVQQKEAPIKLARNELKTQNTSKTAPKKTASVELFKKMQEELNRKA